MGHVDDGPSIVDILRDWWPRRMHSEQEEAEAGVQEHGAGACVHQSCALRTSLKITIIRAGRRILNEKLSAENSPS